MCKYCEKWLKRRDEAKTWKEVIEIESEPNNRHESIIEQLIKETKSD